LPDNGVDLPVLNPGHRLLSDRHQAVTCRVQTGAVIYEYATVPGTTINFLSKHK